MVVPEAVPAAIAGDATDVATVSALTDANRRIDVFILEFPPSKHLNPPAGAQSGSQNLFDHAAETQLPGGAARHRLGQRPANMRDVGSLRRPQSAVGLGHGERAQCSPGLAAID